MTYVSYSMTYVSYSMTYVSYSVVCLLLRLRVDVLISEKFLDNKLVDAAEL